MPAEYGCFVAETYWGLEQACKCCSPWQTSQSHSLQSKCNTAVQYTCKCYFFMAI